MILLSIKSLRKANYLNLGGAVLNVASLFVSLPFICLQNNSKTCLQILIEFSRNVNNGVGDDPDHCLDQVFFIITLASNIRGFWLWWWYGLLEYFYLF